MTTRRPVSGFRRWVLSPFARPGHVGHQQYDRHSILKRVEWRFGLEPLSKRDRAARNLAEFFDFAHPRPAPTLPIVADPGRHICTPSTPDPDGALVRYAGGNPMGLEDPFWAELNAAHLMRGWKSL